MRKAITFISSSARTTTNAAKVLGEEISRTGSLTVVGLVGNLGAGKTTFITGLLKGLGVKKKVMSPTFLILRRLPARRRNVYHLDAYRIKSGDLLKLGIKQILKSPNIVVVEWADRVRKMLPSHALWVKLEHGRKENERRITFNRR